MSRASSLADLRARIAVTPAPEGRTLPFGDARVDCCFPAGGLPLGEMHAIGGLGLEVETGAVGAAFAAGLLARLSADGAVLVRP